MIKDAILLAGGEGTRLRPLTAAVNKHLIPVNGQFIIDYPINTLRAMGVENLTVVLGGEHFSQVVNHLRDGRDFGLNITYRYQGEAKGIAQAIAICQQQMANAERFAVILGDNIFELPVKWNDAIPANCAQIALCQHPELHRFGVASINPSSGRIDRIEEKPKVLEPLQYQQMAITGCYLFDQRYFEFFKGLKPSARNEYEIVDILRCYWEEGLLHYTGVKGVWGDAGTHESVAFWNDYYYYRKEQD